MGRAQHIVNSIFTVQERSLLAERILSFFSGWEASRGRCWKKLNKHQACIQETYLCFGFLKAQAKNLLKSRRHSSLKSQPLLGLNLDLFTHKAPCVFVSTIIICEIGTLITNSVAFVYFLMFVCSVLPDLCIHSFICPFPKCLL